MRLTLYKILYMNFLVSVNLNFLLFNWRKLKFMFDIRFRWCLFLNTVEWLNNNRYYFPFSLTLAASQASIHSLNTSMGSERKLIFAWKSSKHFVHWTRPVFLSLSIFTSQDFSWLQKGQSKIWSKTSIFLLVGAWRFDFRLPIFLCYFDLEKTCFSVNIWKFWYTTALFTGKC